MQEKVRRLRQGALLLILMVMLGSALNGYAVDIGMLDKEGASAKSQLSLAPAGISNPPPAGYTVLYLFTGVANETAGGQDEATVVHCSNFGSEATYVQVQVFDANGAGTYAGTVSLGAGATRTFSTQATAAYGDNVILSPSVPNIFQGSGRVLVEQHRQVICTVQLLDADLDPPAYMVRLSLFDSNGNDVGTLRAQFLPLLLR